MRKGEVNWSTRRKPPEQPVRQSVSHMTGENPLPLTAVEPSTSNISLLDQSAPALNQLSYWLPMINDRRKWYDDKDYNTCLISSLYTHRHIHKEERLSHVNACNTKSLSTNDTRMSWQGCFDKEQKSTDVCNVRQSKLSKQTSVILVIKSITACPYRNAQSSIKSITACPYRNAQSSIKSITACPYRNAQSSIKLITACPYRNAQSKCTAAGGTIHSWMTESAENGGLVWVASGHLQVQLTSLLLSYLKYNGLVWAGSGLLQVQLTPLSLPYQKNNGLVWVGSGHLQLQLTPLSLSYLNTMDWPGLAAVFFFFFFFR